MAGKGQRFIDKGVKKPKALISVHGKLMVLQTLDSLNIYCFTIFVTTPQIWLSYDLEFLLLSDRQGFVEITDDKRGQACTVLALESVIDNDEDILIVNCDNYFIYDKLDFLTTIKREDIDGLTFTFNDPLNRTHWSFAKVDEHGFIIDIKEKDPISKHALCGAFYWKKGSDFVRYAKQMVENDIRYRGEFYLGPAFNEAVRDGKKILNYHIEDMLSMGTPAELEKFKPPKDVTI